MLKHVHVSGVPILVPVVRHLSAVFPHPPLPCPLPTAFPPAPSPQLKGQRPWPSRIKRRLSSAWCSENMMCWNKDSRLISGCAPAAPVFVLTIFYNRVWGSWEAERSLTPGPFLVRPPEACPPPTPSTGPLRAEVRPRLRGLDHTPGLRFLH